LSAENDGERETVPAETPHAIKPVRLIFVGDIMAHQVQLDLARTADGHDFSGQFARILPYLDGDVIIGNLETVLAGPERTYQGYPTFNTPDSLAESLADAGFTVLVLANNHTYDHGTSGALRTVQLLKERGFAVTGVDAGTPAPLLVDVGGLRLGLFNYTYGSNVPVTPAMKERATLNVMDFVRMARDVMALRLAGADYVVASLHWGAEYLPLPDKSQRAAALFCQALGVDAVIGTHPHVLQPVEVRGLLGSTQFVAWSLGNFVSAQRTTPRERSMILALEVLPGSDSGPARLLKVEAAPTWVELNHAEKAVRIWPVLSQGEDRPDGKSEPMSDVIRKKLEEIDQDFRRKMGLEDATAEDGFYTLYEAPSPTLEAVRTLFAVPEKHKSVFFLRGSTPHPVGGNDFPRTPSLMEE